VLSSNDVLCAIEENMTGTATKTVTDTYFNKLAALTSSDNGATLQDKDGKEVDKTTSQFLEFTLVFRSDIAGSLVLGSDSKVDPSEGATVKGVAAPDEIAEKKYGSNSKIEQGGTIVARAANASRVSFTSMNYSVSDNKATALTTVAATNVWCPNEDNASGADSTNTETTTGKGFWKGNLANDYYNWMMNKENDSKNTDGYENNVVVYNSESTNKTESVIATFGNDNKTTVAATTTTSKHEYYEATVTIRIWIEGNDGDCLDAIFGDSMSVSLQFQVIANTTSQV
jgi:hypothetical protein